MSTTTENSPIPTPDTTPPTYEIPTEHAPAPKTRRERIIDRAVNTAGAFAVGSVLVIGGALGAATYLEGQAADEQLEAITNSMVGGAAVDAANRRLVTHGLYASAEWAVDTASRETVVRVGVAPGGALVGPAVIHTDATSGEPRLLVLFTPGGGDPRPEGLRLDTGETVPLENLTPGELTFTPGD